MRGPFFSVSIDTRTARGIIIYTCTDTLIITNKSHVNALHYITSESLCEPSSEPSKSNLEAGRCAMKRAPYELPLASRVSNRSVYRFRTADGVVSKQSFREPELLLLEELWGADLGRLLCVQANYGVVGTVLSAVADSVEMAESSARAAQLCERNIRENDADASVSVIADCTTYEREFDSVVYAPKQYTPLAIGKQRIADALSVLREDGGLYLAASKRTGLTRYEECLRNIATDVTRISERGDYRLLEARRAIERPTYVTPQRIQTTVNGVDLTFVSVPGLFAANALDDGTRLLLETVPIEEGERVLDLCCGYGAIGAYAARTGCDVWLSDDDRVATLCAKRSLRASEAEGTVVTADCTEGMRSQVDSVLCNPPTHAGSGVLSELFAGVCDLLAPDGQLTVVHHCTLDLQKHLTTVGTVETHRTGAEHVVMTVTP